MGCDFHRFRLLGGDEVSIHAPTWGATFVKRVEHHKSRVSIHAPTWGATTTWGLWPGAWRFQSTHPHGVRPTTGRRTCSCGCFNPRTHMGCDVALLIGGRAVLVSIHAPTWGATSSSVSSITRAGFQSTHPHGVRRACRPPVPFSKSFNPRTHMGCDNHRSRKRQRHRGFNPRTHMGCDS